MSDDPRYHLARWKGAHGRRARQLEAEPLCAFCLLRDIIRAATVADHITPHRGDDVLFWDGPLQSLCKRCHDKTKQREEARGHTNELGPDGWPTDARHKANRSA
mgnify:FL=1